MFRGRTIIVTTIAGAIVVVSLVKHFKATSSQEHTWGEPQTLPHVATALPLTGHINSKLTRGSSRTAGNVRLTQAIDERPTGRAEHAFRPRNEPTRLKRPSMVRLAQLTPNPNSLADNEEVGIVSPAADFKTETLEVPITVEVSDATAPTATVTNAFANSGNPVNIALTLVPGSGQYKGVAKVSQGKNTIVADHSGTKSKPLTITVPVEMSFTLVNTASGSAEITNDRDTETLDVLDLNGSDVKTLEFGLSFTGLEDIKTGDKLELRAGGRIIDNLVATSDMGKAWNDVDLTGIQNRPATELTVSWTTNDPTRDIKTTNAGAKKKIRIDTEGPILENVNLTGQPEAGLTLQLSFRDDDLDATKAGDHANYNVNPLNADGTAGNDVATDSTRIFYAGGNTVRIFLGRITVGSYRLQVLKSLTDVVGNEAGAGETQQRLFSSEPSPEQAPQIEFPPFLPSVKREYESGRKPNPGDRVQTRVARLYYFRDAHRVAQLINRMTKSYNRAAVTQAQRRAEEARVKANKLTDERRAKERAAVQAAVETRRDERQLQQAYQEIQRLSQLQTNVQQRTTSTGTMLGGATTDGTLTDATIESVELTGGRIVNIRTLPKEDDQVQGTIINATLGDGLIKTGTEAIAGGGTRPITDERVTANTTIVNGVITFKLPQDTRDLQPIDAARIETPVEITSATITIPVAGGTPRSVSGATIQEGKLIGGQIFNIEPQAGMLATGTIVNGKLQRGLVKGGDFSGQVTAANLDGVLQANPVQILSGTVDMGVITAGEVDGTIEFNLLQDNLNLQPFDASAALVVARITEASIDSGAAIELKRVVNATFASTPPGTQNITDEINRIRGQIRAMEANVATSRTNEVESNEEWKKAEAAEDRAIEDQFLAQVAAAHEDPDTFAPATKNSVDPVAQVSISVIGEGLLHLRGPIHGINEIRKMINQIDSPVGQIKVGIHTVQINGEKGDRMERVAGRIEGHLDLGRFLTNQSLRMLRRAVKIEAAQIAQMSEGMGHYQLDRDRKYLYDFFGRDFVDELYEMDSEFLRSQNKLLSLHSMDTISLNRALFIMALAKNDIRERIMQRFMQMVYTELPEAEWDFRRSSELHPHRTKRHLPFTNRRLKEKLTRERVYRNAEQRYHFRNLRSFFEMDATGAFCLPGAGDTAGFDSMSMMSPDTMNSMQRTFLRLAQIFKSQMIAEEEVKQRIIERAIIEDEREESFKQEDLLRQRRRERFLRTTEVADTARDESAQEMRSALVAFDTAFAKALAVIQATENRALAYNRVIKPLEGQLKAFANPQGSYSAPRAATLRPKLAQLNTLLVGFPDLLGQIEANTPRTETLMQSISDSQNSLSRVKSALDTGEQRLKLALEIQDDAGSKGQLTIARVALRAALDRIITLGDVILQTTLEAKASWATVQQLKEQFDRAARPRRFNWNRLVAAFTRLDNALATIQSSPVPEIRVLPQKAKFAFDKATSFHNALISQGDAQAILEETRAPLNHKKLLDFLIDEREEKQIELLEGTRAYIAAVDQYLKRLSTALEDDFKVQFYDPAFINIRSAAREYDVQLGQVERTTILMNNRAIAIVKPSATMEFDLPKRDIVIVEALNGAKALAQDFGGLLNDPTFLAAYQMMGGGKQASKVVNPLPTLDSQTNEQQLGLTGSPPGQPGSALQNLVPDPAIYKFETGTGFEIRPVIQPDGDSIVYDFHYMYTTNIREPVRADEKHLGRVKRHFIDTQVQTSSFELREVSRYLVALKASRTSRGVPLFEDIPVVGLLFRPAPSDESSLQQNIILAQSTVYPTLFDLMGLRWARHVVDLDHVNLRDSEHIVRGRNTSIEDFVFDRASATVDDFLDIKRSFPKHYRPDLYHQQRQPSPYHPGGFIYRPREFHDQTPGYGDPTEQQGLPEAIPDPTGRDFRIPDRRPDEMRDPPIDNRFRSPYKAEQLELELSGPQARQMPVRVPEPLSVNRRSSSSDAPKPATVLIPAAQQASDGKANELGQHASPIPARLLPPRSDGRRIQFAR